MSKISVIRSKVISSTLGLFSSDIECREDQVLRRSSVTSIEAIMMLIPPDFVEIEEWSDGYCRRVWVSSGDLAVITYCEGDVCISVFDTYFAFDIFMRNSEVFYKRIV